ncbi:MAG: excinuclease ABC subunit UvrA [Syntrophobacterales bacterium]|nr:excinuclease ABC subunit UvrA [Syntrophobacterales bacterium]
MAHSPIRVEGARQNNLKGVTVEVPVGAVTVITGVAGAGKSSLAFDVLYAEGYRRYVETFSPYARQFLERLDRPKADRIEGILPGIAIERAAPVKTSRSTVGTMTSVDDYLRPLFARNATLYCRSCNLPVFRHSPTSIFEAILKTAPGRQAFICFARPVGGADPQTVRDVFRQAGFLRVLEDGRAVRVDEARLQPNDGKITVVLDRVTVDAEARQRVVDSVETALKFGEGSLEVLIEGEARPLRFSRKLHCERCDIDYNEPTAALFSFNNPIGACENCHGFGRVIDIDPDLVIPDGGLSLSAGCVRPFQTASFRECQRDLLDFARRRHIPTTTPWHDLDHDTRKAVWDGEGDWYGIQGFFDWLMGRRYKKQARILLSRYRRFLPCPVCRGGKLKPDALLFRLDGKTFPELEEMAVSAVESFFRRWSPPAEDRASELLLGELSGRLGFLLDVGLGYLSLGRLSRTLSGGETQRVTLATALGSSLTGTLYVLDEPSVGLHPRDAERLAGVLRTLASAGNAVVVVEHDPVFIRQADRVIDLGPGPGERGGSVIHQGSVTGLIGNRRSPTAAYLRGEISMPQPSRKRTPHRGSLRVIGARENNLKDISVDIPLGLLVCVTGVSGSGKSTLIDQVLYRNLRRQMGLQAMEPGTCKGVEGAERLTGVVLIDQAPLTRSSRMNAATYLKVLDPLRREFEATEQARVMGFTRSAFSFNTPAGACPNCNGSGYELVELQFLPDVYIRCPACDGKRFRPEVLDVRVKGKNIAEILSLPAEEVSRLFRDNEAVVQAIRPLLDIGLGYLSLSQPVPTLSGGESQRLKLAKHLAGAQENGNILFILDEPTAGLHPANVSDLVGALQRLVDAGHSVVVVEHDMDVARTADWVIDLGPGGGAEGGRIIGQGSPEKIAELDTPTGQALRNTSLPELQGSAVHPPSPSSRKAAIHIAGAREHNLRNVEVDIPRNRLVAVTGVSGSGKSTLAFDVLYSEGRRRFLDCLPAYARQYLHPRPRPEVDRIEGLPPTVALEQKTSAAGSMSTAGTASEVYHYLRLLFAAAGVPYCPQCDVPGESADVAGIAGQIIEHFAGLDINIMAPVIRKRKGHHREVIERAKKLGFSRLRVDGTVYPSTEAPRLDRYRVHDIDLLVSSRPVRSEEYGRIRDDIEKALRFGGGTVTVAEASRGRERFYSTRTACPRCGSGLPTADPRLFTWSQRFGACPACGGTGTAPAEPGDGEPPPCPACGGMRLRPEALSFRLRGRNIGEISRLPIQDLRTWVEGLVLKEEVGRQILPELSGRLASLDRLGVGYLALDRAMNTLSTGEIQRIRICAELASSLRGACYILDEPTVGLHPRDVRSLMESLTELRDRGNTVVVVEHQEPVIRAADHVVDLGPGAGPLGGAIVRAGPPYVIARAKKSVTGAWLRGEGRIPAREKRPLEGCERVTVIGARLHNLHDVTVDFPLGRLTCVTGVSGSGKSTLVRDVLFRALKARIARRELPPVLKDLKGWEKIDHAKEVDESPIGRTPRSVPATYVGVMNAVRDIFAQTPEARARGYSPSRFSFNVASGQCPECEGHGHHRVRMPLLPVVFVPCEACGGKRYNPDTLGITFKGKTISDVLEMSVDEAADFFGVFSRVVRPLKFLSEIGLGYMRLGQPSTELSGGEAQRTKLASELALSGAGRSFYVLDEPTTGLHMADVAKLLSVLQRLVDRGDTVVVIEHDLDMIAAADCVIDLGPEGGDGGGRVIAWGRPEDVAKGGDSRTAPFLREYLDRHR